MRMLSKVDTLLDRGVDRLWRIVYLVRDGMFSFPIRADVLFVVQCSGRGVDSIYMSADYPLCCGSLRVAYIQYLTVVLVTSRPHRTELLIPGSWRSVVSP